MLSLRQGMATTFLRRVFLLSVAFLCCCLPKLALAQTQAEQQLFDLVNRERENVGLPPLQQREKNIGARFDAWGENVAAAPTVEVAHKSLMESPGHKANILKSFYNSVGIAIVERDHELYVTQDFAHMPRAYNETQVREAVVDSFNDARRAKGIAAIDVVVDPNLRKAACSEGRGAEKLLQKLPGGASLVVFSMSEPGKLPDEMQKAAADKTLQKMNIGVCLIGGTKDRLSKFWIVAASYPAN
jgi:hypothetical protein